MTKIRLNIGATYSILAISDLEGMMYKKQTKQGPENKQDWRIVCIGYIVLEYYSVSTDS